MYTSASYIVIHVYLCFGLFELLTAKLCWILQEVMAKNSDWRETANLTNPHTLKEQEVLHTWRIYNAHTRTNPLKCTCSLRVTESTEKTYRQKMETKEARCLTIKSYARQRLVYCYLNMMLKPLKVHACVRCCQGLTYMFIYMYYMFTCHPKIDSQGWTNKSMSPSPPLPPLPHPYSGVCVYSSVNWLQP